MTSILRAKRARRDIPYFRARYLHGPRRVASTSLLHADLEAIWSRLACPERLVEVETALRESRPAPPGIKEVRAAPRGHAKSTTWTHDLVVHAAVYGYKRYVIIIKDDQDNARKDLAAVRSTLAKNCRVLTDFGQLVDPRRCNQDRIVLRNGVRIEAMGMRQGPRGSKTEEEERPDLFVVDDPENDEMVYSDSTRRRIRHVFLNDIMQAGSQRTDFLFVGTCLHGDALIIHVLKNPGWGAAGTARLGVDGPRIYQGVISWAERQDLWVEWRKIFEDLQNEGRVAAAYEFYLEREQEMLRGAEVLWPEYHPYYEHMSKLAADGEIAFYTEIQNLPRAVDEQVFDVDRFTFIERSETDPDEDYAKIVGFWDPSVGVEDATALAKGNRDFCAFVVVGLHHKGFLDVLDVSLGKWEAEGQVEEWWRLDGDWRCDEWGVEAVAFMEVLFPLHRKMLEIEGAKRQRAGLPPMREPVFYRRRPKGRKEVRIFRLQAPLHQGHIRIVRELSKVMQTFVEMFRIFPTRHMMDGPDALEQAVRMLAKPRRQLLIEFVPRAPAPLEGVGGAAAEGADAGDVAGLSAAERDVRDQVREAMLGVIRQARRGPVGFG